MSSFSLKPLLPGEAVGVKQLYNTPHDVQTQRTDFFHRALPFTSMHRFVSERRFVG
jgi:hypothetical protein